MKPQEPFILPKNKAERTIYRFYYGSNLIYWVNYNGKLVAESPISYKNRVKPKYIPDFSRTPHHANCRCSSIKIM